MNTIDINKHTGVNHNQNYQKNHLNGNNKILICENEEDEQNEYQQYEEYVPHGYQEDYEQKFGGQETRGNGNNAVQYESVEDSLQLIKMINKVSHPQGNQNSKNQVNKVHTQEHSSQEDNHDNQFSQKILQPSKSAQELHTNKQQPLNSSQSKPPTKQCFNT